MAQYLVAIHHPDRYDGLLDVLRARYLGLRAICHVSLFFRRGRPHLRDHMAVKRRHLLGWFWNSTRRSPWSCFHLGMFRTVRMAAGFLFGSEIHHFDAGPVWIVRVQAVFAIAADLRAIEGLQSVGTNCAAAS